MFGQIMSFMGGLGNLTSYLTEYFKNKGIRDTQKEIDTLRHTVKALKDSIVALRIQNQAEIDRLKIEHETEIEVLTSGYEAAANPVKGARVIEG